MMTVIQIMAMDVMKTVYLKIQVVALSSLPAQAHHQAPVVALSVLPAQVHHQVPVVVRLALPSQ